MDEESMDCPPDKELAAFVEGLVDDARADAMGRHFQRCDACSELLELYAKEWAFPAAAALRSAARDDGPTPHEVSAGVPSEALRAGDVVGRYVILHPLGRGGMGTVYEAYDPQLDRRVALKRLRPGLDVAASAKEARAAARLTHPNVVGVYEFGVADGRGFIVMELVEGPSLDEWLDRGEHPRHEVLEHLIGAGRGLAAAHATSVVHCDFKLSNVMLDASGRPRVTDFGLARRTDVEPQTSGGGTPLYMAPEQRRGDAPDARSAQYSFCVSVALALMPAAGRHRLRRRPAAAASEADVRGALLEALGHRLPRSLARPFARGLALEPASRWPSMTDLLDAFTSARRRRRRRRRAVILAGLASMTAGASWLTAADHGVDPCGDGRARLAGVWDDQARSDVRATFRASSVPGADAAHAYTVEGLEGLAERLVRAHRTICEATRIHGQQSDSLMDVRMACLDRQAERLGAFTAVLRDPPDGMELVGVPEASRSLLRPRDCTVESSAGVERLPRDSPRREEALRLHRELDRAEARWRVGAFAAGSAIVGPVLEAADGLEDAPLTARAFYVHGRLELAHARPEAADEAFQRTLAASARSGDDHLAARTWLQRVEAVGVRLRHYERIEPWFEFAELTIVRAGDDPILRAEYRSARAHYSTSKGDHLAAKRYAHEALELWEAHLDAPHLELAKALGDVGDAECKLGHYEACLERIGQSGEMVESLFDARHPLVALNLHNECIALRNLRRLEDARAACTASVATWSASVGRGHPSTAAALESLGHVQLDLREFAAAEVAYRSVLEIREAVDGPASVLVGRALGDLGTLWWRRGGDDAKAESLYRRALSILEIALGPEHPELATTLSNLATVIAGRELDQAIAMWRRAADIMIASYGADSARAAVPLNNIAAWLRNNERWDEARPVYLEVLEIWERGLPDGHPYLGIALSGLGECETMLGNPGRGVERLERAVRILSVDGASPNERAAAQFQLARALVRARGDRARALRLAREARERLADAGSEWSNEHRTADEWLRAHEGAR